MCGIFGVSLPADQDHAVRLTYDSLRQLQGRGQDGSGILGHGPNGELYHRGLGLVPEVFSSSFQQGSAHLAIGHNRYSTQGPPSVINLQPHQAECRDGKITVASNGDLPKYLELRQSVEQSGIQLTSSNDGEVIAWLLARAYDRLGNMPASIAYFQARVDGAYSVVMNFGDSIFAFRDRRGFRPMVMSSLPGEGVAFASEEAAFDIHRADRSSYREVPAGAILEAIHGHLTVHRVGQPATAACIFELMYFARPDGRVYDRPVSLYRRRVGWRLGTLAKHIDRRQAVVVAVPDSANEMANGVAERLSLPLVPALIRAHSARRTFIEREQSIRDEGVRYKLNPDHWLINGRDIFLVDDSIVRGTTMHRIVQMLRGRGARRIILLVGSPPVRWSCFMGIATPTQSELIAHKKTTEEIAEYLQVDQLLYLPLTAAHQAAGPLEHWEQKLFKAYLGPQVKDLQDRLLSTPTKKFCNACFSGRYPVSLPAPSKTE